jgi:hypothetical protein
VEPDRPEPDPLIRSDVQERLGRSFGIPGSVSRRRAFVPAPANQVPLVLDISYAPRLADPKLFNSSIPQFLNSSILQSFNSFNP